LVGILLVTHNNLGASLADCVRHVLGAVPKNLKVLSVLAGEDPQHNITEGEALIMGGVAALVTQTASIQRAMLVLGLTAASFEGSESLDNPAAVFQ